MDDFLKGYLIAALWSSLCDDGSPIDSKYSLSDITPESLEVAKLECAKFQRDNASLLIQYYSAYSLSGFTSEELAGHDLWLTRNGHGVGFWDRGLGELGDKLADVARALPSCDVIEIDPEHGKGLTLS